MNLYITKLLSMKHYLPILLLLSSFLYGQELKISIPNTSILKEKSDLKKDKTYVYNFNLTKITHITNPGAQVNVNLYYVVAGFKNEDQLIYPEIAQQTVLGKLCPLEVWGFKMDDDLLKKCKTNIKPTQLFTGEKGLGKRFSIRIKGSDLTNESKVVFATLGETITYSNNKKYNLKNAHVRSLRLMDIIPNETNYYRYEVNIDGARLLFDYVIERGVAQ